MDQIRVTLKELYLEEIEGVSEVIIKAFELGAKFDGWDEFFDLDIWIKAFEECGVDPTFYANRERSYEEVLPWDHIDVGVTKEFLIRENEKAKNGEVTEDCRLNCIGCGVNSGALGCACNV